MPDGAGTPPSRKRSQLSQNGEAPEGFLLLPKKVGSVHGEVEQLGPWTVLGVLNAQHSCEQDVDIPGFDFLNRAQIQIGQLCKAFLGERFGHPFALDIGAKLAEDTLVLNG